MVKIKRRVSRAFVVGLLVAGAMLLSLFSSNVRAMILRDDGGGGGSGVVPNDLNKLDQANDERNVNNSLNFNSTISNPTQVIVKQGDTQGTVVGGDGALESLLSGLLKTLDGISAPRKASVAGAGGQQTTYTIFTPGALGTTINLTAQLYGHPVASSVDYVADLIQTIQRPFGIQPAYAQGLGFSSLAPVLDLWKLFRNVAYFFFVVIFVVVGFLIMIRAKIGSQAAVTVQQMLPQLVISLILVTFSYAIAGFLIDFMNIIIFLLITVFSTLFPGGSIQNVPLKDIAFKNDIFTNGIGLITSGTVGSVAGSMGTIVQNILVNLGWAGWVTDILKLGTNVLFTLILAAALLIALFRVFFSLLAAYVGIFFSVILAPIQLLLGALPGQNTFQSWIQGLIQNLLVFPVIIFLILTAYVFARPIGSNTSGGFSAPQLGSNQGPQGMAVYQSLIALGVILAMPEVTKIAQGLMKGKIDISAKQLADNLATGNEYAAPAVGAAAGLAYGAGAGFVGAQRQYGWNARQILGGMWRGVDNGSGGKVGGIGRTVPTGFGKGMGVAKTLDRLREGQLTDPDNVAKQLDALKKATEEANKGGSSGGSSGSSGGGSSSHGSSGSSSGSTPAGGGPRAI